MCCTVYQLYIRRLYFYGDSKKWTWFASICVTSVVREMNKHVFCQYFDIVTAQLDFFGVIWTGRQTKDICNQLISDSCHNKIRKRKRKKKPRHTVRTHTRIHISCQLCCLHCISLFGCVGSVLGVHVAKVVKMLFFLFATVLLQWHLISDSKYKETHVWPFFYIYIHGTRFD